MIFFYYEARKKASHLLSELLMAVDRGDFAALLCWTSPQRLIWLIMRFFSIVSRQVFLSSALPYSGFGRIFPRRPI